jgi:transcriptional regulator with XRE-family HTH domain
MEETLGKWIESARAYKRWTQTQLGDEIGVSKANVSHWETGKHEPSFGQLLRIRDVTGYPLRDVGPAAEWPLPMVRREMLTQLRPEQLAALQAGVLGILSALTSSAVVEEQSARPASKRKAA